MGVYTHRVEVEDIAGNVATYGDWVTVVRPPTPPLDDLPEPVCCQVHLPVPPLPPGIVPDLLDSPLGIVPDL